MAETEVGDLRAERRGSDRKKLIVDVRFEGGNATGIANTRDIGLGGLYMTTTSILDSGTPIVMTLGVRERTMSVDGTVVYSDPGHGVGVRFRELSESDETFLTEEVLSLESVK
jgi:PilZ domain